MKQQLTSQAGKIVWLGLMVTGLLMIFSAPAIAQEPTKAETKESNVLCAPGRCGGDFVTDSMTFEAPPNAVEAAVEIFWNWQGHEGQIQENEYFTAEFGSRSINCRDFADNDIDLTAAQCGETGWFSQSDELTIRFTHDDEGRCFGGSPQRNPRAGECVSAGSIGAVAKVVWYAPKPELEVIIDCIGATFKIVVNTPVSLDYTLSDGQSGVIEIEGGGYFVEYVVWQPTIAGQYGPHTVGASAALTHEGDILTNAEVSETDLICRQESEVCINPGICIPPARGKEEPVGLLYAPADSFAIFRLGTGGRAGR